MKDSFFSFYKIEPANWVINIRGRYKIKAANFLRENLINDLLVTHYHSKQGWFFDSQMMLADIKSKYVLLWIEDHLNLADISYLKDVIREMEDESVDCLIYTFYEFGQFEKRYNGILKKELSKIKVFNHTLTTHEITEANHPNYCSISYASIMKTSLFKKIVKNPPQRKIWPIETPFDFEKPGKDTMWLPIKIAIPNQELFASIDDDRGIKGYSLQSRGIYPIREIRKSYAVGDYIKFESLINRIKEKLFNNRITKKLSFR